MIFVNVFRSKADPEPVPSDSVGDGHVADISIYSIDSSCVVDTTTTSIECELKTERCMIQLRAGGKGEFVRWPMVR